MTHADKTLEQIVAEVLYKHRFYPELVGRSQTYECSCHFTFNRTLEWEAHVAAELAPLFAWREAEARLSEAEHFRAELLDMDISPMDVSKYLADLRSAADAARAKVGVK
jgi:hypothetical protein